jgi:thiol-disulfide isomerase/thioredoxin
MKLRILIPFFLAFVISLLRTTEVFSQSASTDEIYTVKMSPSQVKKNTSLPPSTIADLMQGEVTVGGETYTVFIPAKGPYQLKNTAKNDGLDIALFSNAAPVWVDANQDGEVSDSEVWVSDYPIRFGDTMLDVTSISDDGTTLTMKASESPLAGLVIGESAPDFTFVDQNGNTHTLEQYKGKYLVLDAWSSTCGPCQRNMPHLRELQEEAGEDKLQVLLLSMDMSYGLPEVERRNSAALTRIGVPWANVLVPGGWNEVLAKFNIQGYGLCMIDPDGKTVVVGPGHNMDDIYRALGLTPKEGPTEKMDKVLNDLYNNKAS